MKKTKSIVIFLTLSIFLCCSKNPVKGQSNKYKKAWITMNNNSKVKGYMYELKDSAITMVKLDNSNRIIRDSKLDIDISKINYISVPKKGKIGKRVLIGSISGLALGIIVGNVVVKKPDPDFWFSGLDYTTRRVGWTASGTIIGGLVGGMMGTMIKTKIPIRGNRNNYKSRKYQIQKYVL